MGSAIRRGRALKGAALTLGLLTALSLTACGAGNEAQASGDGSDAVTLNGGGATSQAKAESVWRANYQTDSGNTVNYEEVGSGTGRQNFNSSAYDFAGTDSYINDDEGELSDAKTRCGGGGGHQGPGDGSPPPGPVHPPPPP